VKKPTALEQRLRLLYAGRLRAIARCGYCDWTVEAPVDEAHAAFEAHVCERPKPARRKRRVAA